MNTVFLVRNAAKTDYGGAEIYQLTLARELQNHLVKPIIVTRHKKLLKEAKKSSISTIKSWYLPKQNWSGKSALLFPLYLLWQLLLTFWYIQIIIRKNPSTLHLQSKDDFIAGTLAGRLLKKRVVWTDHADLKHIFENTSVRFKNPTGKLVLWCAKRAHHIIMVSQNELSIVDQVSNHQLQNLTVVHNSIPDTYSSQKPVKKHQNLIFCIANRTVLGKGIEEAITAFNQLSVKYPHIRLHIYGTGNQLSNFKNLARTNPKIKFFGHTNESIAKIHQSDILLSPTHTEGFSITLLEAAMLQKPIIATKVGGNPELIINNQTGLLIKPKNTQKLADSMETLINNPTLCQKIAKNAREKFLSEFNFTHIVKDKTIPLYANKPIKVRVEASCLATKNISGVGAYTQQLIDALVENPQVKLYISYFNFLNRQPQVAAKNAKTHTIRIFPLKIYAKLQSYNIKFPFDILQPQVDLTIFPNFACWPTIKTRYKATTIHDLTHVYYPDTVEPKNLAHLNRTTPNTIKHSDLILTVSETSKSAIAKEYKVSPDKILVTHIAPNPMYFQKSKENIFKKYQIPFQNYILFMGNFEPRKNLATLIKAYPLLPESIKSKYGLVLVGGNSWKNQSTKDLLDQTIVNGENLLHIDHVSRTETVPLYQQSSLYVMPSTYEGFGMPVVEAMACKIPVLCSDIQVLKEVGQDACLYAKSNSPKDFAKKIQQVLENPALQKELVQLGTKNIKRFNWQQNTDTLLKTLTKL